MKSNTNTSGVSAERVRDSEAFKKASNRAQGYAQDPAKLRRLLDDASRKADAKKGPLQGVWRYLSAFFRLIRAYADGRYREIPWSSMVMIVASILYFLMPLDLIPDFILGLGFLDDVAMIGWTAKSLRADLEAFEEWEVQTAPEEKQE